MNELQKIIEGFKKAGEICEELSRPPIGELSAHYYDGKLDVYKEVVGVLEDFMSKHSVFCINIDEPSAKVAEGYRALIKDLEEERSN